MDDSKARMTEDKAVKRRIRHIAAVYVLLFIIIIGVGLSKVNPAELTEQKTVTEWPMDHIKVVSEDADYQYCEIEVSSNRYDRFITWLEEHEGTITSEYTILEWTAIEFVLPNQ